jgi:putative addiction module killer protein
MAFELHYYQTEAHERPFVAWLEALHDRQARARIEARLARVAVGNFGDRRAVGESVFELRIDWGPGYRIYFAQVGQLLVLLLCGGDKRSQQEDIDRAKAYFKDFKRRTAQTGPRRRG